MKRIKVEHVNLKEGLEKLNAAPVNQKILSFYSSVLQGITTEPALCTVPMDDHMVHRGHAVFDTCSVKDGKAYGLSFHLDRFLLSASTCRISPPYADKESLREIILQTIAASGKRNGIYVRFWMSAGRGDFDIRPSGPASFYCAVHEYSRDLSLSLKEVTVSVPPKCPFLATSKTNNYLVNALTAMEAKEKGGKLGLQCFGPEKLVQECSIGAVAFVFPDNVICTPTTERILKSTTLFRANELWKRETKSDKGFVFCDLTLGECKQKALEMIEFGGGHCQAVVEWDGVPVGNGIPGPIFQRLFALLESDAKTGEFLDEIPY